MTTDYAPAFEGASMMSVVGFEMTQPGAQAVYEETGVDPDDI
jgi:hypothetical protein